MTEHARGKDRPRVVESIQKCYSGWSEGYFDEYCGDDAAYPPVHYDILRNLIKESRAKNILDVGCGPASFLRCATELGAERYGFDLTPAMVKEAKRVLSEQGVPENHVWDGDVVDPASFVRDDAPRDYESAVCVGVLPHVEKKHEVPLVQNIRNCLKPGGLAVIEGRNELFSIFTLNRYSHGFFLDRLLDIDRLQATSGLSSDTAEQIEEQLAARFRMDQPPQRTGSDDAPGYDEILSRSHNPFEVAALLQENGFENVKTHFYHYHALPPFLSSLCPDLFKKASLEMENPSDWRGYLMASAFLISGVAK